jgi:tRNA-2-methylthio-N6-dimethylallyladenosine synthase
MSGHIIDKEGEDSKNTVSAYIALMRGCNRFCSYCIVPYVRGREKSREAQSVIKEARKLVDCGIKEIMILGQNVAAYGLDGRLTANSGESPFADLLAELSNIEGLERIRFVSPHPSCFNDKLIEAVTSLPKVCKNMHLPLQSGSDRILKTMNRGYTAEDYYNIVQRLKKGSPDITFSTDIIVGFPGETQQDFDLTREMFNKVRYDNAFIFKYSPRRGTKAADMDDSVTQKDKEERNHILLADLKKITSENNTAMVGRKLSVLVEGESRRNSERWFGRTTTNKTVVFTPDDTILVGDIIEITVEKSTSVTLFGKVD